jgi:hypothetical protein
MILPVPFGAGKELRLIICWNVSSAAASALENAFSYRAFTMNAFSYSFFPFSVHAEYLHNKNLVSSLHPRTRKCRIF